MLLDAVIWMAQIQGNIRYVIAAIHYGTFFAATELQIIFRTFFAVT